MADAPKKSKLSTLEFVLLFVVLYFVTNTALKYFFPKQFNPSETPPAPIVLTMESEKYRIGNDPIAVIENTSEKDLVLPERCPQPPLDIAVVKTAMTGQEERTEVIPNESALPCKELLLVKANSEEQVNLAGWKFALFSESGEYEVSLELPEPFATEMKAPRVSARFFVTEPGFFTKLFRTFITKPLFNALIFVGSWIPGHNLGLAIIVLTILIKILLLLPNQHALEGQKKLQELQPRMEEIKRRYPDDNAKVQEETMKLWKEMKINPLQSCLPTLLQLPILLGLFFVIQEGAQLATAQHLLYPFYKDLPPTFFGTTFLGIDLLKPEIYFVPILLVILQFIQMKMMMAKKKPNEIIVKPSGKRSWIPELNQQTVMTYVLPVMIGVFAYQFAAAVSIYWGVSTVFGIVQQWFVMREKNATK